ncbi:MAG: carbamoyltransferase C-terminal domain-containing protein [Candidatus Omnitrophota bacterium]
MIILGVNSYHPDSSAAVVIDGRLIAACEEERFCRVKHFSGLPLKAITYCLKEAGVSIEDVDYIAVPRDTKARAFNKILYGIKMPSMARRRILAWGKTFGIKESLAKAFDIDKSKIRAEIKKIEHHRAHLASTFFVSGFDKAFLFSADALGDFGSTAWGIGEGNSIKILGEVAFPHSLGFYYTAITQYLGFMNFGDEYKVMGLAPYGRPAYEDEFKKILKAANGRFRLGLEYFLHHKKYIDMNFENCYPRVDPIYSPYLEARIGKARGRGEPLEKRHKDVAFCLQKRLEEVIFYLLSFLPKEKLSNLCLSGGVAHNCVVNGKLPDNTTFSNIYVPPAPGDAGLAIGAAMYLWNHIFKQPVRFKIDHAFWGPSYNNEEIKTESDELIKRGCVAERIEDEDKLCERVASEIAAGKIIGWFQGRMEFGPRALGARSILADPRKEGMKDILNAMVKRREEFRPFAPSILEEYTGEYFTHSHPSPFMSFAYNIRDEKRKAIPAVCHVDGTARLQTVNKNANRLYWKLIDRFRGITGIPVLLNTSFNENEPIILSPKEAADCFLRNKMDLLVMGSILIKRAGVI